MPRELKSSLLAYEKNTQGTNDMEKKSLSDRASRKKKFRSALLALSLVATTAIATILTIDARGDNYRDLTNVRGTTYQTDAEIRTAAVSEIAARYRLQNGLNKLPSGTEFRVIYGDGSSERAVVVSPFSSLGAAPVPGTGVPGLGGPCDLTACPRTNPT